MATRVQNVQSGTKKGLFSLDQRAIFCCCWLLVLWGASRSARKKASSARPHWRKLRVWGLAAGRLFSPDFFSMRVLRFMMFGDCWGQNHGFRPRCTDRAPEWSPKRKNACFSITDPRDRPIPTLLPIETCTQTPLDRPRMRFHRDPEISPTHLKPPKMAVFVTISPPRVFSRNPSHQAAALDLWHRLRANIGCGTWLRSRVAFPPRAPFWP